MFKNTLNFIYLLAGLCSSIKVLHKCMKCIDHQTSLKHVSTDWHLRKITQYPSYFELKVSFFYINQKLSKCHRQNLQVSKKYVHHLYLIK